jgi:hypothetical protein
MQILHGPSIPRLEDELAYYIQSLIFSKGNLIQKINLPPNINPDRLAEIFQLPYLIFENASYYSSHFHGWSFIIYLFSIIKIQAYTNSIVYIGSFFLFYYLLKEIYPANKSIPLIGLVLFLSSPILLFMTVTYMSHLASFLVLLCLSIIWFTKKEYKFKYIFFLFFTIIAFFIRPQSAIPFLFAIGLGEFLALLYSYHKKEEKYKQIEIYKRGLLIAFSLLIGTISWYLYAKKFPGQTFFFTEYYFGKYFSPTCQSIGFGPGHGCYTTFGTYGHSIRKVLLIFSEEISFLNHEFSFIGLPLILLAIYSGIRNKRIFKPGSIELSFLFIFTVNLLLYGFYWHSGGESYGGRYLIDTSFTFYFLLSRLFYLDRKHYLKLIPTNKINCKNIIFIVLFSIIVNSFLQVRGEYINIFQPPYRSVNEFSNDKIQNSIINGSSLVTLGFKPSEEKVLDEFHRDKKIILNQSQIKAFINVGNVNFYASTSYIDRDGFFRDNNNNLLLWDLKGDEISAFSSYYGIKNSYIFYPIINFKWNDLYPKLREFQIEQHRIEKVKD